MLRDAALTVQPLPGHPAASGAHARPRLAFARQRGHCRPFGATPGPGGVNFAVFSRHADGVSPGPVQGGPGRALAEIPLDPTLNRTGDVWHVFVHGLAPDLLYGYRVHGPFAPKAGHRFNPQAVVLDPYAPAISGGHRWGARRAARRQRPADAPRPAGRR